MKKKLAILFLSLMLLVSLSVVAFAEKDKTKAFRSINFGDSKDTVGEKISEDDKIETKLFGQDPHVEINNTKFWLRFAYHNDKLYRIIFDSNDSGADYLETRIKGYRNILAQIINNKYGESDYKQQLSILKMQKGEVSWSHKWTPEQNEKFEDKRIKVGIGKQADYIDSDNEDYYATMWIEYLPIIQKMHKEWEQEQQEEMQKNSDDF